MVFLPNSDFFQKIEFPGVKYEYEQSEQRKFMKSLFNLLRHIKYLSFTWSKLVFFNFFKFSRRYFLKFPNNRCCVGQQPILSFWLKINAQKDLNGHFVLQLWQMCTVKRLYGRKILMQHDLAQKKPWHFAFFYNGTIFFDKFCAFWPCKCPTIFLRETVVNKRIRIIKDNYHMEYIAFDWGLIVEKWAFMIFFRQCQAM